MSPTEESDVGVARRTAMPDDMPRSLVDVRTAVRLALGIGGALTLLELMMVFAPQEGWLPLVTVLPSVVTWFFVASAAARAERGRAVGFVVVGLVVHFAVGLLVAMCMNVMSADVLPVVLVAVAMLTGLSGVTAAPVIVGASLLASKKDLEAGDLMLGLGGAWLALLETAAIASLGSQHERGAGAVLVMILGCALGVGTFGVFVARAIARRQWCARVARGDLQGWRVRLVTSAAELATLPPVFGSAKQVSAVVERVELAGLLYRSGLIGQPVAAMRLTP